jgi:hypothetical protein
MDENTPDQNSNRPPEPAYPPAASQQSQGKADSTNEGLKLAAFVMSVVDTVLLCWLIVPLAWMVPMTVHTWGIYKGKKPNTVCFAVCSLLFTSLVAGVCLLIADKDEPRAPERYTGGLE